jgi:phosphatidylinositol kinase/protein kinase (PI-3  family)
MIDGLGITGYEGIFLRVCEITLSVLRTHRETLMSVLETFIHDPLVEWTKSQKSSGEVQNPHAQVSFRWGMKVYISTSLCTQFLLTCQLGNLAAGDSKYRG